MARVTFDDEDETRPEFRRLVKILNGDYAKAIGTCVMFFQIAQRAHAEYRLVSHEELELAELDVIIESKWGIVKEGGIECINADKRFGWYRQKCDAGKKSVASRKNASEQNSRSNENEFRSNEIESRSTKSELVEPLALVPALALVKKNKYMGKKQKDGRYTPLFDSFWDLYEKKGDKKQAFVEFIKLKLETEEDKDTLVRAIKLYKATTTERKYRKDFCRYLKTDWKASLESLPYNTESVALTIEQESI